MKLCKRCGIEKDFETSFYKSTPRGNCRDCIIAKQRIWYANNREESIAASKKWREENPERNKAMQKAWAEKNKDRLLANVGSWQSKNKDRVRKYKDNYRKKSGHYYAAKCAERRAIKLKATPSWADRNSIIGIYKEAARITAETGVEHEVDHIVPLRSKRVCGLHVQHNLRVIPASENFEKRNYYWPDMP